MGDRTGIEWADATWTPIRARYWQIQNDGSGKERLGWHCEHVSEGCRFCYAERLNLRLGTGREFKPAELYREEKRGYHDGEVKLYLDDNMLALPLRWRRPRLIFPCSMTDAFADFVPDAWLDSMLAIAALAPQHRFLFLTKRPERTADYLARCRAEDRALDGLGCWHAEAAPILDDLVSDEQWEDALGREVPLDNVLFGCSIEDQRRADERREAMLRLAVAGWKTIVSYEPALGPVDWQGWQFLKGIISGGESGPEARPSHPDWHRGARDFCQEHGIAYFFKQWGEWTPGENVETDRRLPSRVFFDGRWDDCADDWITESDDGPIVYRAGKKAAGRALDGREHSELPK